MGDSGKSDGDAGARAPKMNRAYQGAFEAVVAIAVSAGLGAWADARFDTSPILLMIGVVLGFATFVLRLMRLTKSLAPDDDGNES